MLLRDNEFDSLEELCAYFEREVVEVKEELLECGYIYDEEQRQVKAGVRRGERLEVRSKREKETQIASPWVTVFAICFFMFLGSKTTSYLKSSCANSWRLRRQVWNSCAVPSDS